MNKNSEQDALQKVLNALSPLDEDSKAKLLRTVSVFFGIELQSESFGGSSSSSGTYSPLLPESFRSAGTFSDKEDISPKSFLVSKEPKTDVERVACLAYYLTHYRNVPHFKTLEISKLNTEAAQPKFSNAAFSVSNASRSGYLVPASRGSKQISALGEQFVMALPDREKAKLALGKVKKKKKKRIRRAKGKRHAVNEGR